MAILKIIKNSLLKGIVDLPRRELLPEAEQLGKELKQVIDRQFHGSFQLRQVSAGSCGACESEVQATINPLYDLQRFGVDFVASPKHADALLVTGPISRNMLLALQKTYEALPGKKFVIAVGDCAVNGGLFKDSYYTLGGVDQVLTVDLHIPGCPPSPTTIIKTLLGFLK
ncbi:MAG: NADH-quinone oxidoreductase subunit NuoB [Candidatus Margulisbacteria bacterium]|jgi:Ni,Fe-hydrogenase III small subunit|nr:NADH-quinone oxidoreductase subunit NuoB [Candidatus Margulisiibacteriota bacterium]